MTSSAPDTPRIAPSDNDVAPTIETLHTATVTTLDGLVTVAVERIVEHDGTIEPATIVIDTRYLDCDVATAREIAWQILVAAEVIDPLSPQ